MKKIECILFNCNADIDFLENTEDKKAFTELQEVFNRITPGIGCFSITVKTEIFAVPEGKDFEPGLSLIIIYPKKDLKRYWPMVQKIYDNEDNSKVIESVFFTLHDLEQYANDFPPYKYHIEVDTKATMWVRGIFEVIANSEEEARKEAIRRATTNDYTSDDSSHTLIETEEMLSLKENYVLGNVDQYIPDDNEIDWKQAEKDCAVVEVVECYKITS